MSFNDGRVVSNFIHQALLGEAITIYGKGEQTRSFCYVSDLIDGFVELFFQEKVFEPINLGNPNPISILNLAQEILELTSSTSNVVFKDLPSDDPKLREPNIAKAQKLLNWEPKIARQIGLSKTIEDFRVRLSPLKDTSS
jgi:nucleoside-diphosphate-sugar epimerase